MAGAVATLLLAAWAPVGEASPNAGAPVNQASSAVAAAASPATSAKRLDRTQIEAWADRYLGRAIAEKRAPGITISVIQDGELLFAKGYGYADYAKKIPVDPEQSGFIVGSVTKTFIATSVAQLVDRGAIASFDDPVNKYLKRVQLKGPRGAKVTIRHLLTHRAGFEDTNIGMEKPSAGVAIPLTAAEIEKFMPVIAMEPGGPSNYSNWSFALLGFLVEDVSGQRLDQYLKTNIWDPLGMSHTGIVYGKFPSNLSVNYTFKKDGTPVADKTGMPHPWIAPAGAIVSTATDMARYMRAQVLRGENGGYPLMSPKMFKILQTEVHRNAPIAFGFAHAFWVSPVNGAKTIEHGGGAPGFQTMMVMIPEQRLGFFMSTMQGGLAPGESYSEEEKAAGRDLVKSPMTGLELRESFIDAFLKNDEPAHSDQMTDLSKLPGVYRGGRRAFSTPEVLAEPFNPAAVLTIELTKDGKGVLMNGWGPYRDIGGGVFASPTARYVWDTPYSINQFKPPYIAFTMAEDGSAAYLTPGISDQAWARASPIHNPKTMLLAFLVCAGLVLTAPLLFAWPQRRRLASLTNYAALAAAGAVVALPASVMLGFAKGDDLIKQMLAGDLGRITIMMVAGDVIALLALVLAVKAVTIWKRPQAEAPAGWPLLARRLHLLVVAAATVGLVDVLRFFNLLGIPG